MLWPFEPRPTFTETIRFATDVVQSDSAEMRYSLHGPLQNFSMTFALDAPEFQIAQRRIEANPNTGWQLPMWHERQTVSAAAADSEIACDTNASFEVGGDVVIWADWHAYTVAVVASVGAASVTLTAPLGADYAGALLMPVRSVNVRSWGHARQSKNRAVITALFEATDTPDLAPASGMVDGYSGPDDYPVIGFANATLSDDGGMIERVATFFDSGHGSIAVVEGRSVNEYRSTVTLFAASREQMHRMARMIHQARGKDRPVWVPESAGFLPVAASTATTITVPACSDDPADHIGRMLLVADGVYREITGASASGATHVLTIDAITVAPQEVAFMRRVRFDSDAIDIAHSSGFMARCQIPVVEVS